MLALFGELGGQGVATLLGGRDAVFRTLLGPVRPGLALVGAPTSLLWSLWWAGC
ncbi:hypothetical protein AB0G85_38610 [Streptomyces sioyaensis]|uniref:hypothetical protein n=1 Tax=Streptomyces sioyaensis TaxID=67364 RepID=UPI00340E43C0